MAKSNLKPSTRKDYARKLLQFTNWINANSLTEKSVDPLTVVDLPLETIEDLTEQFIRTNIGKIAPKQLNSAYCGIKKWLFVNGKIKSTKMFREIDFDKSSRKTSALLEEALENHHIKTLMQKSDLSDKIDLGLYALCALRPSLIPQLKVSDIFKKHIKIENGQLTLRKPCFMLVRKDYEGNKAHQDMFIILPRKLTELLELRLNEKLKIQRIEDMHISDCDNERDVYFKMKTMLTNIGFNGRPYMLRKFGNELLKRIETIKGDRDLKEFLMLHKGSISQVYADTSITAQKEEYYTKTYLEAIDDYVNREVFEMVSSEEKSKAYLIKEFAKGLGASLEDLEKAVDDFEKGKIPFDMYLNRINALTKVSIDHTIEKRFEELFNKAMTNHNNNNNNHKEA